MTMKTTIGLWGVATSLKMPPPPALPCLALGGRTLVMVKIEQAGND